MLYQKEIKQREHGDLVVCGGGFSGFAAAYSAAREGMQVLLVEQNTCLGGVGTAGLVNHILGVRFRRENEILTCVKGVFAEIENELVSAGNGVDYRSIPGDCNPHGWKKSLATGLIFDHEAMKLLLEEKLLSAGVRILYGTRIVDVIREKGKVRGIVVHNKSGLSVISGDYFVDATGDGDICAMSGCAFALGDEEGGLAAASLEMHVENVDQEKLARYMKETDDLRFTAIIGELKKKGLWDFPYEIFISVLLTKPDVFMINTIRQVGIDGTDGNSLSEGVLQGRKENFRLLEVMRKHFPGFENATVRMIAPVLGIRETRRIESDYTLTVADLIHATSFEDSIALSGYSWDMPNPQKPSYQPYHGVKRKSRITEIPYRALVPKGVDNVLAVGRCIGVEREALGVVRVMGPCLAMGEAAGIAAHLAALGGLSFRKVDTKKLRRMIEERGGLTCREQVK